MIGTLKEAGADQFAVSSLDETLELRQYEPDRDILVLGNIPTARRIVVAADLQHAVTSCEKARLLSDAAEEQAGLPGFISKSIRE